MSDKPQRLMLESEIPSFVEEVVNTGSNICAFGQHMYVVGDAGIPDAEYESVANQLDQIKKKYGDRDHLRSEIIAYLRSRGRYLDDSSVDP